MRSFATLTSAGQARRLRVLARAALEQFGLQDARLSLIQHRDNTTFRVEAEGEKFLLRVHRAGYQTAPEIASELAWLSALARDTQMRVPDPVAAADGALVVSAQAPGVPEPHCCSLLRWVPGRFANKPRASHIEAVGEATAWLHNHAAGWARPTDFSRRRWDWEGLFGDGAGFGQGVSAWQLLPAHRGLFERAAERTRAALDELGESAQDWGLIHADLHFRNVLFCDSVTAHVIDFDDCGFGHWIYDLAVTLNSLPLAEADAHRESFLRGYRRHRAFSEEQLRLLPTFIAARNASLALWSAARAQDHPGFRERLPWRLEKLAEQVCAALPNERR